MSAEAQPTEGSGTSRWQPISAVERRVLGVLIEKAKTTPENYPLSLNSLRTGCNQKSNRAPLMQLEDDQVAEALENLRKVGAVAEIQGGARIDKYRHLAYEWLGVDKVELAVMAELLLRGAQTVGELRGRAARMEPIKGLAELQPILDSLLAKRLVVRLTPAGRGAVITHALYLEQEMEKVRREAGAAQIDQPPRDTRQASVGRDRTSAELPSVSSGMSNTSASLGDELRQLREELAALRTEFEAARSQFRQDLDELNRQLGN
jgi:uncharacterized protein YceH (UPF0502 family)